MTDVEEDGVVTIEPRRGWNGTRFTATLMDDDNGTGTVDWLWERSSNGSSWTVILNATQISYTATADDIEMYLRATASYDDTLGQDEMAEAVLAGRIVRNGTNYEQRPRVHGFSPGDPQCRAGDVGGPFHRRAGAGDG